MNKHTPGPWSYWSGYNHVDKLEAEVTADGGDIVIASYNSLIEQGEANACLMAAAPELLKALERIAREHDCGCVPCVGSCRSKEALEIAAEEIQEIARAAIAKAQVKP